MREQVDSPNDVINATDPEPIVIVKMLSQRGNINPNEICGLPASKAASYIRDGVALELEIGVDIDADANPLRDLSAIGLREVDEEDSSQTGNANSESNKEWKFDAKTDPFTTDGLSKQASMALHAQNLHTVDAVRNFIANLPEDVEPIAAINEIDGITDNQAEKIVKLYGMTTEHSE